MGGTGDFSGIRIQKNRCEVTPFLGESAAVEFLLFVEHRILPMVELVILQNSTEFPDFSEQLEGMK